MANFLGIAGPMARGYVEAQEDIRRNNEDRRRQAEADFIALQRQHLLEQQAQQKELGHKIKGISKAKDVKQPTYTGMTGGLDVQDIPTETVAVSRQPHEITRDVANAYIDTGLPEYVAQGINYQGTADQQQLNAQALDERKRAQAVMEKWRNAYDTLTRTNDPEVMFGWLENEGVPYYNAHVPDGYKIATTKHPEGRQWAVIDPNGRSVQTGVVTRDMARDVALRKLNAITAFELGRVGPDNFQNYLKQDFEQQKLGLEERKTKAIETQALAEDRYKTEILPQIHELDNESRKAVARIAASAHTALNPRQQLELEREQMYVNDLNTFTSMFNDPKNNAEKLRMQAQIMATRHPEKSVVPMKIKDTDGNEQIISVNRFDTLVNQAFKAAGIVQLPVQLRGLLQQAAKDSRGKMNVFLKSSAVQQAVAMGAEPQELLGEFMGPELAKLPPPAPSARAVQGKIAPKGTLPTVNPAAASTAPRTNMNQNLVPPVGIYKLPM